MRIEAKSGRLLVSIHDVGPLFEARVDALVDRLNGLVGEHRFAMLVVPDHWDQAPLSAAPAFRAKLRRWAEAGVEMFLHGWRHRDDRRHAGLLASLKARHMTAGEGEFLGLGHDEAMRLMVRGRDIVEDAVGVGVAGFIAPAWLYGPGARSAMAEAGFEMAEDHLRVWRPADGAVVAHGPVVTWASRSRSRIASSLAAASVARHALRLTPTVRVAVHPGDVGVPALLASIDATLASFARRRIVGRYADLIG